MTTAEPQSAAKASFNPHLAAALAWILPGAGHVYLGKRSRGVAFLILVLAALVIGCVLDGKLYSIAPQQPLSLLATLASMGAGSPYFVLRYLVEYQGDVVSAGYEYGTAFLLTAGLMNLLLVLDAWDISRGKKE